MTDSGDLVDQADLVDEIAPFAAQAIREANQLHPGREKWPGLVVHLAALHHDAAVAHHRHLRRNPLIDQGMLAAEHYALGAHFAAAAVTLDNEIGKAVAGDAAPDPDWLAARERRLDVLLKLAEVHGTLAATRVTGVQLAQLYSVGKPAAIRYEAERWAQLVTGDHDVKPEPKP